MSTHPLASSASSIVSFDDWLHQIGKTRATGWRWRKSGLIQTQNIFGRLYVTRDAIAAFERRAMAGEFARDSKTPTKRTEAAR